MKQKAYSDIPKFKTIERRMRQTITKIQATLGLMADAKTTKYERTCLEGAAGECILAIAHTRKAIHELYSAFDKPGKVSAKLDANPDSISIRASKD